MSKILCLETATTNCSVALSENGSVIAFREDQSKDYSHAEQLHVFIESVLKEAQTDFNSLSAIAVSKGPGSYTGLRIGISAAKGLCYSLDIPLVSVPTLTILMKQVETTSGFIVPMIDARRMEVYASVYNIQQEEIRKTAAEILHENSFQEYLEKGNVTFIGSGVIKFKEICNHPNAKFINTLPSSLQMTMLAYQKFKKREIEDLAYFEPFYLKDFLKL